jgi:hypothetical protein
LLDSEISCPTTLHSPEMPHNILSMEKLLLLPAGAYYAASV